MERKNRNSNYELLRIVSMLFIVLWHVLMHGGVLANTTGVVNLLLSLVMTIIVVHVNSFVLVTGYYQSTSKFKLKKLFELLLTLWFYQVGIVLIGTGLGWFHFTPLRLIFELSPFSIFTYWFINVYLILYCLSPFLNQFIGGLNQKMYKRLLFVLFFLFSVLTSIYGGQLFNNSSGYSPINFIMLYLIGAYFRRFPITESKFVKGNTRQKNGLILLGLFTLCFSLNFLMGRFAGDLVSHGNWVGEIGMRIANIIFAYDNVFVVLGATFYFLFFGTLNIKSKWINRIASSALDVYMIHDHNYIRVLLYPFLGFTVAACQTPMILIRVIIAVLMIYIGGTIIGLIRIQLFHWVGSFKISRKIKQNTKNYINQLGDFNL